ncbi:MAG: hypothetical protein RLZZ387_690 [Chloroflexota bacterium]|jgi:imidazolonepropionase-like amidohydrolase
MDHLTNAQRYDRLALTGGRLILPDRITAGKALVVEDGQIAGIAAPDELGTGTEVFDVGGRYIAPRAPSKSGDADECECGGD